MPGEKAVAIIPKPVHLVPPDACDPGEARPREKTPGEKRVLRVETEGLDSFLHDLSADALLPESVERLATPGPVLDRAEMDAGAGLAIRSIHHPCLVKPLLPPLATTDDACGAGNVKSSPVPGVGLAPPSHFWHDVACGVPDESLNLG